MNLIEALNRPSGPTSLPMRFRRARARRIRVLIEATAVESGSCRIIDLGGTPDYWSLFDRRLLEACKVRITLVNPRPLSVDNAMFRVVQGDACAQPRFADQEFDLVHSNSVIEHVGDWARMEDFATEVRRLAPRYYVQTPYFWFPVEPHYSSLFFHWRSEQWRARRLMRRAHGFAERAADIGTAMRIVQDARLLDKAQFRFLFPDAEHHDEQIAGLTKSLIAVRAQAS